MPRRPSATRKRSTCKPVDMTQHWNWPSRTPRKEWLRELAGQVRKYPAGSQESWGIPFNMACGSGPRVAMVADGKPAVTVKINGKATFICFLHQWAQAPEAIQQQDPTEGLVVGEYEIVYSDDSRNVQPVRTRFEVAMAESPGPVWLAMPFEMWSAIDPVNYPDGVGWGRAQIGLRAAVGTPLVYVMENPAPEKRIRSLIIRGILASPLLVAGITLYRGQSHPLAHLPRRVYRVNTPDGPARIQEANVDLGGVARIERTAGPRGSAWLKSKCVGTQTEEPERGAEDLVHAFGARDAKLSVTLEGRSQATEFALGEAFEKGRSQSGKSCLEVLDKQRQWMQIKVVDSSTGRPTPVRVHFSGRRGEYIAPYGHHAQVNTNWFEDYGADVVVGGRNYAYVPGEFTTDMPVGEVYVEIYKGFEYEPVRTKVNVKPGEKQLNLQVKRWKNLRDDGWVTADTHVHFVSPHSAWLEAQAEGVNVVNLLASQWGRLFTNVGDYTGRVGVVEDDTIVYVGTENRNHMLGHMSMLGTKGLPVYPMCCGGPGESWVGDPDFRTLAEWALENKRKGGVVIRPHYPYCGHTEDPVPILKGLVDALEININRDGGFPVQEWYRYLNCGYRVAVAGGTDKMGASTAMGWLRTYAQINRNHPLTYDAWARAVRSGRTISSSGALIGLQVDGQDIGDTIKMSTSGGTVAVDAWAESFWPLGRLEIVCNGRVVACERALQGGVRRLRVKDKIRVDGSGWIAARCSGHPRHPGSYTAAHTSPVYVKCGDTRAFDGPAAEHMLALVEGGTEYLNTLATVFDESSRKRMVKLFNEARRELRGRLIVESDHTHHHGHGQYHTHGHGQVSDHKH